MSIDITALRALLALATPGRWVHSQGSAEFHGITALGVGTETIKTHVVSDAWPADAALICTTVNALPELLAIAEAAMAYVDAHNAGEDYNVMREYNASVALTAAVDAARKAGTRATLQSRARAPKR